VPTVPETKFFEVAPSLKSVFDNTDKPFSLFGSQTEASEQSAVCDANDDDDDVYNSDAEDAAFSGKTLKSVRVIFKCLQL